METVIVDVQNRELYTEVIQNAATILRSGNIVAFPTETVYGLGGIISRKETIDNIYTLKGRPADNPLIVHCHSYEQLFSLCFNVFPLLEALVTAFMPGPLTIVTKKSPTIPNYVTVGLETIALRIPSNKVALDLLKQVNEPIAAPSANLSGKPSPTEAKHVLQDFSASIPMILDDGPCQIGIESTVVLVEEHQITLLRPGIIDVASIESALDVTVVIPNENNDAIISPGTKYRHYAPNTPIRIVTDEIELLQFIKSIRSKTMILLPEQSNVTVKTLEKIEYYSEQNLYSLFRKADEEQFSEVVVFVDTITSQKMGLMNRLKKAAAK
jgi:L-threonylcarbamoyladenylate synthase